MKIIYPLILSLLFLFSCSDRQKHNLKNSYYENNYNLDNEVGDDDDGVYDDNLPDADDSPNSKECVLTPDGEWIRNIPIWRTCINLIVFDRPVAKLTASDVTFLSQSAWGKIRIFSKGALYWIPEVASDSDQCDGNSTYFRVTGPWNDPTKWIMGRRSKEDMISLILRSGKLDEFTHEELSAAPVGAVRLIYGDKSGWRRPIPKSQCYCDADLSTKTCSGPDPYLDRCYANEK